VFVPRGSAHGFANPAATAARFLVVTTPRAIQLVEGAEQLAHQDGPIDMAAVQALFSSHDSELLGPPPA